MAAEFFSSAPPATEEQISAAMRLAQAAADAHSKKKLTTVECEVYIVCWKGISPMKLILDLYIPFYSRHSLSYIQP
jgi:hypothetical protein